jgi:hypothetical protein
MPISPGRPLPDVPLQEAFDEAVKSGLRALAADTPVLLFVYKDECPATLVAGPVLPRFGAIAGLGLAALSQDAPPATREFARRSGWAGDVRVLVDPEPWPASRALAVRTTPTWILVERGGRVLATAEGWSREDANSLAARAAALLGVAAPLVSQEGGAEPPWRPG